MAYLRHRASDLLLPSRTPRRWTDFRRNGHARTLTPGAHQRPRGLADGIVMTPSHNPPRDGGFKYNATSGGPAEPAITRWIEDKANDLLTNKLQGVKRITSGEALRASTTHRHDY